MKHLSYREFRESRSIAVLQALDDDVQRQYTPQQKGVDLKVPVYSGFYKEKTVIHEKLRKFIVFVPSRRKASGPGIFLLPPDHVSAEEFLVRSGWVELAEENGFVILAAEPFQGEAWNCIPADEEFEYIGALYQYSTNRNLYSINESSYYAVGYGTSADILQLYAAGNAALFAGIALIGGKGADENQLAQQGSRAVTGNVNGEICEDKNRNVCDIPLPVWFVTGKNEKREDIACWIKINRTDLHYTDRETTVFYPDVSKSMSLLNQQPVQTVRWTQTEAVTDMTAQIPCKAIWDFLRKVRRHAGTTLAGTLRPSKTWEELGLVRRTGLVEGREREWLLFVPGEHKRHPEKKLPLVIAVHGYSCSGEIFMNDSEWYKVAEERGFFVVFPSACVNGSLARAIPSMRDHVPLPSWNSSIPQDPEGPDELLFFRTMIDQIETDYPIDPERKYLCGHSNGALQTQCLMLQWPSEFAAYAPHGAALNELYNSDKAYPPYSEKSKTPMWLFKGTYDVGCGADFSGDSPNRRIVEYVAAHNGCDLSVGPEIRPNGNFINYTYTDDEGNPSVIFTELIDCPHAYSPEIAWVTWDQFFSHYLRKADGTLVYVK